MGIAEELQKLDELHRKGALNDLEYSKAKALLLKGGSENSPVASTSKKLHENDYVEKKASIAKIIAVASAFPTAIYTVMASGEKDIYIAWIFFVLPALVYAVWSFWLKLTTRWSYVVSTGSLSLMFSYIGIVVIASRFKLFEADPAPETTGKIYALTSIAYLTNVISFVALIIKSVATLISRGK